MKKIDMEDSRIVVGLDIGTTKICAVVGKNNANGDIEVLGLGEAVSEGVVKGKVANIDKTVRAIRKAIDEAELATNIDIRTVNVGVAGQHINSSIHHGSITRTSKGEEITVEDVKRLTQDMYKTVMPPGNEIIHVMPQDYMVDYEYGIKDPVGMSGVKLAGNFHLITAPTNAINSIYKCVERAGLGVENLILEPLASSLAVLSDDEKEAGVCLVDMGGGTSNIAIFQDSLIRHTAVIPLGGINVTGDIKHGCRVMESQAEQLKLKFGKALVEQTKPDEVVTIPGLRNRPPKDIPISMLASIIEARLEEIFELIHEEILSSGLKDKLSGGIVFTGGAAQIAYAKTLFKYVTELDVRLGHPNEHLVADVSGKIKNPIYATAVGLVLAGFKALDFREDYYKASAKIATNSFKNRDAGKSKSKDLFSKFLEKTKGLLIDDDE